MLIKFFFPETKISLRERTRLKQFIVKLFDNEEFKLASLVYIFCSDEYLLKLNKEFLKHDYYTDIITFELSSVKGKKEGEIYISIDRVKENAQKFNNKFLIELYRVVFHGALHLCGYKDKTQIQKRSMKKKEDYYLRLYLN